MFDTPLPHMTPEEEPLTIVSPGGSAAFWGGFLAGVFNWYLFAKIIAIYLAELMLSVRGSRCGTCWAYANNQIYVVIPFYLILSVGLWKAVSIAAPFWINWTKWPMRLAVIGWLSVVGAVVIANWL